MWCVVVAFRMRDVEGHVMYFATGQHHAQTHAAWAWHGGVRGTGTWYEGAGPRDSLPLREEALTTQWEPARSQVREEIKVPGEGGGGRGEGGDQGGHTTA
jgi:hypothetical protein